MIQNVVYLLTVCYNNNKSAKNRFLSSNGHEFVFIHVIISFMGADYHSISLHFQAHIEELMHYDT